MAIKTRDVFAVHVVSGVATDVHQELRGGEMAAFTDLTLVTPKGPVEVRAMGTSVERGAEIICVVGDAHGAMRIANVVLPANADAKTVKASVDRVQQNNFQRQLHRAFT
jgi:hypothetical protein